MTTETRTRTASMERAAEDLEYTCRQIFLPVDHEDWLQNLLISASRGGFRQIHRIR